MRALLIDESGRLRLRDIPEPSVAGECLIRVIRAGICGTDLQLLSGYAGFSGVPGHEFVGRVESVSEPSEADWIGRRIVGEINIGCGRCAWCRAGVKEHCESRSVLGIRGHDGAFAEYLTLPAANLHHLPASISDDAAVFVEPAAAACRILEQVTIGAGTRVAVLGDGRMGLLVAQVLRTAAPDVTVLGKHEEKLAIARAFGLSAARSDAECPPSDRYEVVVDVTGRPEGFTRAMALVRPRGTIVLKSTFHGEMALVPWPIVVDEVTIVGSRCGPFDRGIAVLASGAVDIQPLVARRYALEEHERAFEMARRSLKVLFDPSPGRSAAS